jgi:hypothetical protein
VHKQHFIRGALLRDILVCVCTDVLELSQVYSTKDGSDLAALGGSDIMPALIAMQSEEKMDFPAAIATASSANGVTHVLDFGPGGNDSVGGSANFTSQLKDGCGVTVVACVAESPGREDLAVLVGAEELTAKAEDVTFALDWADFAPKLVKRACDGAVKRPLLRHFHTKTDAFAKTGSGQTEEELTK